MAPGLVAVRAGVFENDREARPLQMGPATRRLQMNADAAASERRRGGCK